MAAKKQATLQAKDLRGFKYFKLLTPLLERLHDNGTARDKAGNRQLFFDQYGALPGGWGDFSYTVGLMRRFGGEVMSQDGKQVTINTPGAWRNCRDNSASGGSRSSTIGLPGVRR